MSNINSSLAYEEIETEVLNANINFLSRHLSISNAAPQEQAACQIVKVSGNITVSF